MQGRDRDTDVENGLVETVEEGEGRTNGESSTDTYTTTCKIASGKQLYNCSVQYSVMT